MRVSEVGALGNTARVLRVLNLCIPATRLSHSLPPAPQAGDIPGVGEETNGNSTATPETRRRSARRRHQAQEDTVACVTGGTGFLGCAVVRHLLASGRFNRVVVMDMVLPPATSARRMPGAEYVQADLCTDNLDTVFRGAHVVVHTAGRVVLYDDPGAVFNAHVVATRRVIAAARRVGVRALVVTSSSGAVTTPFTTSSQLGVPSNFQPPPDYHFPSHYARTKYRAERDAIAASGPGFSVCALRIPGVYGVDPDGVGDPLIIEPTLNGPRIYLDAGSPRAVDFVYVENAAAAHAEAAIALLDRPGDVAGCTINVANSEPFVGPHGRFDELIKIVHGDDERYRRRPLPIAIGYALAWLSEALYAFTAGRVPWPRAGFWQLTRATVGLAVTEITLVTDDNKLGFVPPFSNTESFHDIKRKWVKRST